jgi:hypothetical protein
MPPSTATNVVCPTLDGNYAIDGRRHRRDHAASRFDDDLCVRWQVLPRADRMSTSRYSATVGGWSAHV